MDYLGYCFQESLRIEPPIGISPYQCFSKDINLGGVNIKKDDIWIIPFTTIQNDPENWQQADSFLPDRFNPDSPLFKRPDGKLRHPFSYLPFSGGQRICLGKTFAEMMVRFTISIILYHVELELVDPEQLKQKPRYQTGGKIPKMMMRKTARRPIKV